MKITHIEWQFSLDTLLQKWYQLIHDAALWDTLDLFQYQVCVLLSVYSYALPFRRM